MRKRWKIGLLMALGLSALALAFVNAASDAPGTYDKKIVPIISVGQGLHIGAAEVVGPKSRVAEVKAVAQLEADFKKLSDTRIRALVPVASENVVSNLKRVDQVAVSMYGDVDPRKIF